MSTQRRITAGDVGAAPFELPGALRAAGVTRGDIVALVVQPARGLALAAGDRTWALETGAPERVVEAVERDLQPRWAWWSNHTAVPLIAAGVRVGRCWDVTAVHRVLFGGGRADVALVWAALHDLPTGSMPALGQLDLLGTATAAAEDDADQPEQRDGHLRPEWVAGAWADNPDRWAKWAGRLQRCVERQRVLLERFERPAIAERTARIESTAELLCRELEHDGLPIDVGTAEAIIASAVGPRPADDRAAATFRSARDDAVLRHVSGSEGLDLRNPAQVRSLLRRVGIEVPDTRAWRLETLRTEHPVVEALLAWRKAERIATTYGYGWLDQHVGRDGRLRGAWSGSDGAAGRMTAQAGLHNLPAELRPAVAAEDGHVFVRADLGQIEPRVLAAVSDDAALTRAAAMDDLYAPVAERLGVERSVAKVAVLAAMYGQTSGTAGQALHGLETAYPVAMRYLRDAEEAGRAARDIRTYGGRLVRMSSGPAEHHDDERTARSATAARGRYARNAVIQGAAAELFKAWAVTVRARVVGLGASIVLCLHDELLVHVTRHNARAVVDTLDDALREAAQRWAPGTPVRFVTDTTVVERWSDAG